MKNRIENLKQIKNKRGRGKPRKICRIRRTCLYEQTVLFHSLSPARLAFSVSSNSCKGVHQGSEATPGRIASKCPARHAFKYYARRVSRSAYRRTRANEFTKERSDPGRIASIIEALMLFLSFRHLFVRRCETPFLFFLCLFLWSVPGILVNCQKLLKSY